MSMKRRSAARERAKGHREWGRDQNSLAPAAILAALRATGVPIPMPELARRLKLRDGEHGELARVLEELEHAGSVIQNRRGAICLVEHLDLVRGTVQGHRDG